MTVRADVMWHSLCRARVGLLMVGALVFHAAPAHAQWYKPWRWHASEPAPAPPPAATPQAAPPQGQGAPVYQPQYMPAPQAAPVQQAPVASAPAVPQLTPQQIEDRKLLLDKAHERDTACDSTVACAKERLELWQMVQIEDPASVEGRLGYARAQRDFDAAKARDDKQQARDESLNTDRLNRLREAEAYIRRADLEAASTIVDDILAARPDDERAKSMRAIIELRKDQRRTLIRIIVIAVVALILIVILVVLAVVAVRKHKAAGQQVAAENAAKRATLQVVDGVGRGRSASLTGDVFRIGAAEGDDSTRNDLVLSDADARISRFHCNVTKQGGKFFVIDTSSNGTVLNGSLLRRGEPKRLGSGDTLVLAESAVLTLTVH